MDYQNTKALYDKRLEHHSKTKQYFCLLIWFASIPFAIPVLIILFLKVTGILGDTLPWPWQLFKKGAWSGTCPVCSKEVYFTGKSTMKEIVGLSCDCGACFHLENGDQLVYDRRLMSRP